MRARFLQPVYDGDAVEVATVGDADGSSCATARGSRARRATALLPRVPHRRRLIRATGPTSSERVDPPPASPEALVPGTAFGLAAHTFRAERAGGVPRRRPGDPARSTATRASPTRRGSSATPTTCCRPTSGSVRGSTSSRPCSTSASCATARWCRPGPRDRRVGAEGPPLRHARRAPPRRRSAGGPHDPHRDLPATGHVSRT